MLFRQLFERESSTYTYLLAARQGGEALLIDPKERSQLAQRTSRFRFDASEPGVRVRGVLLQRR